MASPDTLQRIAVAVTPAVMVSACGLIALGLDNQAGRMSLRLRELAHEFRSLQPGSKRRAAVAEQVAMFSTRHALIARALLLNYGALFAFIATSLSSLIAPAPIEVALLFFVGGVGLLAAMALFAIASLRLSRAALSLEARQVADEHARAP